MHSYLVTGGGGPKAPQQGKNEEGVRSSRKKEKGVKKEGGRRKKRKNEGDKSKRWVYVKKGY